MEEIRQKPLKKRAFERAGSYYRFIVSPGKDLLYNYEVTQDDLKFLAESKELNLTVPKFEKLIDLFEKGNAESEEVVLSFDIIREKTNDIIIKGDQESAERVYEYWKEMRMKRGGKKGLLKKYWKAPGSSVNDPRVTFRRLKDEKRNLRRTRKYDEDYLKKVLISSLTLDATL